MVKGISWRTFLYINIDHNIENTVFLAGTGRAGTTWLSDLINYDNYYRYMFEPFFPQYVKSCRGFRVRQYIRPDNKDKYFIQTTKRVLSGSIRNVWIDMFNKKIICRGRLIKDIRANLFLKWMHNNFPSVPIVFTLRHPCPVAHSRTKLNWGDNLDELITQRELVDDFLSEHVEDIRNCKSQFERYIYLWCIENYVPLKQFAAGEMYILFYENLCCKPEEEIKKLFQWLRKPFRDEIMRKVRVPSKMSQNYSAVVTGEGLVDKWKKHITPEQIDSAVKILSKFGLDRIYDSGPMPKTNDPLSLFQ